MKFIKQSFDKGFFVAVKAIQVLRKKNEGKVMVVGVAGPSGAGKTSLAQKIISILPKSVYVKEKRGEERGEGEEQEVNKQYNNNNNK